MALYNNFTILLNDFIGVFKIPEVTARQTTFKMLMPTGDERVTIRLTKLTKSGNEKLRAKYQVSVTGMFDTVRVHEVGKRSVLMKNHHTTRTDDFVSYDTTILNKKDFVVNEFKTILNNIINKIYCGHDNVNIKPITPTDTLARIMFMALEEGEVSVTFTPEGFIINQELYPTAKSYDGRFVGEAKRAAKPIAKGRLQAKPVGYGTGQPTAVTPLRVGMEDPELLLANLHSRIRVLEERIGNMEAKFVAMFDTSGKDYKGK